ncbi:tyrosine-type recombinase/integrase [Yoonia sp.]|uniref:tyrosine-type recombinase/integrase n=1 Tax=Yoonia sp. TaxID=2212373 RepID=UPI00358F6190
MQITPNGAKSWMLRTTIDGKRRKMGLGSYPTVTLAQARERARDASDAIWHGKDPIEEQRVEAAGRIAEEARSLTFAEAVDQFLDTKLSEIKNEKHQKQWRAMLETYACPVIGSQTVSTLDVHDIRKVLESMHDLCPRIEPFSNSETVLC